MQVVSKKWDTGWESSQHHQVRERRSPATPGWIRSLKDTDYSVGDLVYIATSKDKVNYFSTPKFPGRVVKIPETGMSLIVDFEHQPGKRVRQAYPVWKLRHATVEEALEPRMWMVGEKVEDKKPKKSTPK